MKSVIELLRELRADHDLSQTEIATVLGISQQHYSKYENEEYELPIRHFIKLAEYYGVSADYLIGRCELNARKPLELVYVTREYTCEELLKDTLSLDENGRQAVVDYVALQKLKESSKKA